MFEGLRKPMELITIVVTRLSYGCPVQAIVQADRDWTNERVPTFLPPNRLSLTFREVKGAQRESTARGFLLKPVYANEERTPELSRKARKS